MYFEDVYEEDDYSGMYYVPPNCAVPDEVKKFLQYFQDTIREGNVSEISNLCEVSFPKLTDQYFATSSWPEAVALQRHC